MICSDKLKDVDWFGRLGSPAIAVRYGSVFLPMKQNDARSIRFVSAPMMEFFKGAAHEIPIINEAAKTRP